MHSRWANWVRTATWLATIAGGFLAPPPPTAVDHHDYAPGFAIFVIAVFYGSFFPLIGGALKAKGALFKAVIVAGALVIAGSGFFVYNTLLDRWTALCGHADTRLIIGDRLKPKPAEMLRQAGIPLDDHDEILGRAQSIVSDAWETDAVPGRRLGLDIVYVAAVVATASCVLLATDIADKDGGRRKRARPRDLASGASKPERRVGGGGGLSG